MKTLLVVVGSVNVVMVTVDPPEVVVTSVTGFMHKAGRENRQSDVAVR